MEMPVFLPMTLDHYRSAQNDGELFLKLSSYPEEIIPFFMLAADDETWSLNHSQVMQEILNLLTKRCFENKLEIDDIQQIQKKIQEHIKILDSYLPSDIIFKIQEVSFPENSLLFSGSSPIIKDLIRHQCLEKNTHELSLPDISIQAFEIVQEFVKTGEVAALWKNSESELKEIQKQIRPFGVTGLETLCQTTLKRYINQELVIPTLIEAHLTGLSVLREACFEYVDNLSYGIKFEKSDPKFLVIEFLDFKENALTIFAQVKHLITHLIFKGKLSESLEFSTVVNQCPLLLHLNLSLTTSFSERIFDVASSLLELDISSCNWLNQNVLIHIFNHFPCLKTLKISDNIQLPLAAWGTLSKLKQLINLDISRNSQIHDDDFKLILQSCPQVTDFDCSDCRKIGDKGFFELTRSLAHLIYLNLARCQISDGILIEMAVKSSFLEEIDLTRCELLSDRGILEFVKQAKALKRITLKQCHIRNETLAEIKRQKPYLLVSF